ncbi:FAD-binding protein [Acidianus brierleyi]|uniref:FAD linked oxidase N-terminal domain-containing protein n=1 Tax=Acidianus brierleyi TaxID=41673 RepID=A0A2U9IGG6_9CREN|nr:FAD-binding protein [Acidianus brierleyi]AWR95055.1 FAD-binding protein [Acidianus brierleyi]
MLKDILSKYFEIYTDKEILEKYSMDYSYLSSTLYDLKKVPEAIVKITTEEQIKTLLELSQEYNFYIIVRGSGTNTLGETVPIKHYNCRHYKF